MRNGLKEEIAQEVGEAVVNVIRRLGDSQTVQDGERALRDGVKQARRYAGELADDAQESSRKFVKYANQELRDHPFAAFGAGLAIGALIGMVVASRVNED